MTKVSHFLVLVPLCLTVVACDPPPNPDGGTSLVKDGGAKDGGLGDAGDTDAGQDIHATDGGDAGDAGPGRDEDDAGYNGSPDAGPDAGQVAPDAGPDAGPTPDPDDEAGGLLASVPVSLPFSTTVDLTPAGDSDCWSFEAEIGGVLTASTGNTESASCSGGDTELFLYADGATDVESYIDNDDDGGDGTCSLIETTVGPGRYVVCVEHYSRAFPSAISGATVQIGFVGFVCGNDVLDPGEECDGVPGCTAQCQIDDGFTRETEAAGNNVPQGAGVQEMFLDEAVRGSIVPGSDVDWWLLHLPGGLDPGAVVLKMGNVDLSSTSCGAASDIRVDIYGSGDVETPAATSVTGAPCRVTTLTQVNGDAVFGDETVLVRVSATGDGGAYHLLASYIEGDCGNGAIEPSEECDPNVEPLGADCHEVTCRLLVPSNDTCDAAIDITGLLPEPGQHLVLGGQTITASDSSAWTGGGSCQSSSPGHQDVHYTFTAPSDGVLVADLNTSWDAALYLTQGACETGLRCSGSGYIEEFLTAGQVYTLVVDGGSDESGRFDLDILYLPAPVNNTCESAIDISADLPTDGTKLTLSGDTRSAADSTEWTGSGSCESSSNTAVRRDVHYTFTAPVDGILLADLDTSWDAVLYLTEGTCGTAIRCSDPGDLEELVAEGRTYTLVVDAWGSAGGSFDLDLEILPLAENDTCQTAIDLTAELPLDGTKLTVAGDTRAATDSSDWTDTTSCQISFGTRSAPEVFYTFTAQQTGQVYLDLDSPDWDAVIYTYEGACVTADQCDDVPEEILIDVVQGQTYTVVVDGYSSGRGAFELDVFYALPPANDQCAAVTAVELPADGTPVLQTGDTRFSSNDASASCSQSGSTHPETFHVFTAPIAGTVEVVVDTPSWNATVYALDGCGGGELACAGSEEFTVDVTAGQTLVVVVDAYDDEWGEYTLNIRYDIPPPFLDGGDTCQEATPLLGSAGLIQGTLDGAMPDYDAELIGDCADGYPSLGPDVVYSIELQPGETLQASYAADADGNDEQILLLDACPPSGSSCVAGADFSPVEVVHTNNGSQPKTYFIVIDEYGSLSSDWAYGTFELSWSVTGP